MGTLRTGLLKHLAKRGLNFSKGRRQAMHLTSISLIPVALCHSNSGNLNKIQFQPQKEMTHEYLIQQASTLTMNAVSQLLTQTVVAICDIADQYTQAMMDLLSLVDQSQYRAGDEGSLQDLSDMMIEARARITDFKQQMLDMDSLFEYVEKVVVAAAEASFLAGAEYISTSLSERLMSAKLKVDEKRRLLAELETECIRSQKNLIDGPGKS